MVYAHLLASRYQLRFDPLQRQRTIRNFAILLSSIYFSIDESSDIASQMVYRERQLNGILPLSAEVDTSSQGPPIEQRGFEAMYLRASRDSDQGLPNLADVWFLEQIQPIDNQECVCKEVQMIDYEFTGIEFCTLFRSFLEACDCRIRQGLPCSGAEENNLLENRPQYTLSIWGSFP